MKIVEQVDKDGNIFLGPDTSLSPKALFDVILQSFPKNCEIYKDEDGMICGNFKGKRFSIRVKNITYLGHPHPLHKKRIQIPGDLQEFYRISAEKKRTPILLGVYTCGNNTLFCDFNIEDFVRKKANNSSAHVHTGDLAEAAIEDYFYKEDAFSNKITVFTPKTAGNFLAEKLGFNEKDDSYEYRFDDALEKSLVAEEIFQYNMESEVGKIKKVVKQFFEGMNKKWNGIECYREMIDTGYRNKYQPEWPGFYLEYKFERYLCQNDLTNIIQYAQDKSKGGIDLDLFFPRIRMYGDLKAHSCNSTGIQGNDWRTVFGLINIPYRENRIYYIVCEHDTEKDSEHGYEVTQFWNRAQGKKNLTSYGGRMKNSVELARVYIFDINADNKQYLTKFKQGVNSNGKPREPKIMIEREHFEKFILAKNQL